MITKNISGFSIVFLWWTYVDLLAILKFKVDISLTARYTEKKGQVRKLQRDKDKEKKEIVEKINEQ